MSDDIRLEVADRIATITLDRPERRNAFTRSMIDAWAAALAECRAREDVHVVVVTGAGRAFCSGGDIKELMGEGLERSAAEQRALIGEHVHRIPLTLADMDKPAIAAINGAAIGAGLDLALAMDLRFAGASATFAETYVKVGLAPGAGGAHWLPRLVGRYPPRPADAPPGRYGSAPHTDFGCLTLLAQDDAGGLEVRATDGSWITAPPVESALLVNTGDIVPVWSGGRWRSTAHRVVNPPDRDRYSIAYFYDPCPDAVIAPLDGAARIASGPAPFRFGDHVMAQLDATYAYRQSRDPRNIPDVDALRSPKP